MISTTLAPQGKALGRDFSKVNGELVKVGDLSTWKGLIATFTASLSTDKKEQSRELYKRTLTQYFLWVINEGLDLNTVTGRDIVRYSQSLQERGLSSLTISSYLTSVKLFYEWAESEKIYPNIARVVKSPRRQQEHRKKHLADDKSRELLEHFRKGESLRDYAIVNLKLRCGLRNIEITRANVEDIELTTYTDADNKTQTRRILRLQRKGHLDREGFVVLSPKAYEPIKVYLNSRSAKDKEPLFKCESNHKAEEEGRLTTRSVSRICKEGLRSIGLDDRAFTAHSLRHTTACAILRHGGSLIDAQGVLGHASPSTTQIYTKDIENEQRLERAPELALDSAF